MLTISDIPRLISELTLEEKASLCSGSDFWHTQPIERLGIPAIMVADGPHGLRKQAEEMDHLGVARSVPATCFPTAAGLGSTWDPALLTRVGEALGRETRANEVSVLLGPGVNMKRSPSAAGTSSTSPRTCSSPASSPRPWSTASSPRAWAPR